MELNRRLWDELTELHVESASYGVNSFLSGGSTLGELEVSEVGSVDGKRLVHLMCHFGLDTLSWARLGAEVTGIDFSPRAITVAKSLADQVGLKANFVCADVLSVADMDVQRCDIVVATKGVLMWVADLTQFARVCCSLLKPGGIVYILDFHPLANLLGQTRGGLNLPGSYFGDGDPIVVMSDRSYGGGDRPVRNVASQKWAHSLGDLVSSLAQESVRVDFLHEFAAREYSWTPTQPKKRSIPTMFSIHGTVV